MTTGGNDQIFEGLRILVTGGTGSLGNALVQTLMAGTFGRPARIVVMSRDEAKQHFMRTRLQQLAGSSEHFKYVDAFSQVTFLIGDVRNPASVSNALRDIDVVIHAAALKQVPVCEYQPLEAIQTNVEGASNIVQAIRDQQLEVSTVIGISTDKACQPVNAMGMTKALQERIFLSAGLRCPDTRFAMTRYGNVLASRGSVIPHFHDQIRNGGPVTITLPSMTRFLLSLDEAVEVIADTFRLANSGELVVPRLASARVVDLAKTLIGERDIPIVEMGIRPGEKIHEVLVAEDEAYRAVTLENYYIVTPSLPELQQRVPEPDESLATGYRSDQAVLDSGGVENLLRRHGLMLEDQPDFGQTFLYEQHK